MKNRILSGILIVTMILTMVVSTGAMAESEEEITLRFAWWGGDARTEATLAVIEQFEALYPNITIEPEYGSSDGYHDKLATQLASGTAADIVQVDPETLPTYVATGDYFLDYNDYDFDLSNFEAAYIGKQINGNYDGKQLGLPTGIAGPAMIVNEELAEQFGIDFTADYDWDDLIEWGKMVHEADPDCYLLCINKDYITNLVVLTYLKQLTGTTVFDTETKALNATEEDFVKAFELVKALYDNNVIAPASYTTAYNGDNLQSDPNWVAGKYVCTFTYISTINVMTAANTDATYISGNLPILEGATEAGWACNCPQVMCVTSTCEHPEAAMAFMDYFFNNETAMSTLACTRSVPPTEKARTICAEDGTLDTLMMDSANIVSAMGGTPNDKYISSQEAKQIVADEAEIVGYGNADAAEAGADLLSQLESYVEAQ